MQHVDLFVYELGFQERDLAKRAKIDYLRLTSTEWPHAGQFADLHSVRNHLLYICSISFNDLPFISMRMLLSTLSRPTEEQRFIWPFRRLRRFINPGHLVLNARSIHDLRLL